MTDDQLLQLSSELKGQTDEIVALLNLKTVANKYAECHQIGSSVMDLMVDEDIDFACHVQEKVDIDQCLQFAKELLTLPGVETLRIKNYLDKPEYKQFKVYIDPYKFKDRQWQIAFSFEVVTQFLIENEIKKIDWVKNKLTPETKMTILRLKKESRDRGIKVAGAKIYDAVLKNGLTSLDQIV